MFNPIEFARAEEALLKLRAAEAALTRSEVEHEERLAELQRNHEALVNEINSIISVARDAFEKSLHDILHERNLNEDAVRALIAQRTDALIEAGLASLEVPIDEIRPQRRPGPARGTKRRPRGDTPDTSLASANAEPAESEGDASSNSPSDNGADNHFQASSPDTEHAGNSREHSFEHDHPQHDQGDFDAIDAQSQDSAADLSRAVDPFDRISEAHLVGDDHSDTLATQDSDPLIASLLGEGSSNDEEPQSTSAIPGVPPDDDEDWN